MNLLVTGGCGFIGSNLIRHIIDRPGITKLINLDCLTYAGHPENLSGVEQHARYVFERVDLRDKAEVLRVVRDHAITHVMHLAAESHVDRSITGPGDFIHTNVLGTFHLLEACRELWRGKDHGPQTTDHGGADDNRKSEIVNRKSDEPSTLIRGMSDPASQSQNRKSGIVNRKSEPRFLHVSTDEVYGSLGATGLFTETTPYAPNSPYSASKASSDLLVRAYHHTYGLPAVITNCSNNYGPYQFPEKLIPVVIQNCINRKPIPVYGDGLNVRDWLYVTDHAEALWQVLTRGALGETYNIGGHNEWANLNIVRLICDLVDELGRSNQKAESGNEKSDGAQPSSPGNRKSEIADRKSDFPSSEGSGVGGQVHGKGQGEVPSPSSASAPAVQSSGFEVESSKLNVECSSAPQSDARKSEIVNHKSEAPCSSLITFVKDRLGHDRRYAIDAGKIQRELGWVPAHTFETGIRETVAWYLANQEWVKQVSTKS